MAIIRAVAPAKLNLFLHVTGKRNDGYHLLESLVAFAEFGDALEIKPAEKLTLDITGPFSAALQGNQDNIVIKAARLLKESTGCKAGAHIVLEKYLPVGAGLGGGSSDAAAILSGLQALWNIRIENDSLQKIALQLGSDVPVCLTRRTAWMRGIGEQVTPVGLRADSWAVLVNPGFPLLTVDVFRHFSGAFTLPDKIPEAIDSFDALMRIIRPKRNDLEAPAMALAPAIGDVLAAIKATPDCRLARMSGSGTTCFGLYDNADSAERAAKEIKRQHREWWSVAAMLGNRVFLFP